MAHALAYRTTAQPMIVVDPAVDRDGTYTQTDRSKELFRSIDVASVCSDPRHWKSLANRAARGDRPAYRALLNEFSYFLQLFFNQILPERTASKLVDETLVSVTEKFKTCDTKRSILPWLLAIAEYRAANPADKNAYSW